MAKWISDPLPPWIISPPVSIICREVHSSHTESHSAIAGNPTFNAKVAVLYTQLQDVVSVLLGKPENWPKGTSIIQDPVCVSCQVNNDTGRYTTDADGQIIDYSQYALLDLVYMARAGVYVVDNSGEDVFWNDEEEPRVESRPMNYKLLVWGNTDTTVPTPKIQLLSDEAPSIYENGANLVHTIEGFDISFDDLEALIGTVHNVDYLSPVNGKNYVAGTLLLDAYQVINHYNFKSYRHGAISVTLKLFYKFKGISWSKFWRNGLDAATTGYHYMRHNKDPWPLFDPFPLASHIKYLGWIP